jgi:hypothetical protein
MRQVWFALLLGMVFVVSAQEVSLQEKPALQKRINV